MSSGQACLDPPEGSWEAFAAALLDIAGLEVTRDRRLIEDLGLDSLDLLEFVAWVTKEYPAPALEAHLADRAWPGVTAGELFDECQRSLEDAPEENSQPTLYLTLMRWCKRRRTSRGRHPSAA